MSDETSRARETLLETARERRVERVHLQFTDVQGAIKMVTIPGSRLERALDGVWFDGSAVEGLARVVESDLYLRPDPSTFAVLPWEATPTARVLCDLCLPDGSLFPADPRAALKAVLAEACVLGFDYRVACEVEFFVFADPTGPTARATPRPVDTGGYFELSSDGAGQLCLAAAETLGAMGITVEGTHHEVAPGQHEIDLGEMGALQAADAIIALKWALRALGRRAGLTVSFMPKPLAEASGSGLHVSQVLAPVGSSEDAFLDAAREYQLSDTGRHFIAGQLAHARGMCAVVAPLVNSYKRLCGGAEAPGRVCWGRTSRGALVRVPDVTQTQGTRVEFRSPDPSSNPYLAFAVMLKAGLDGIQQSLPLPPPVDQNGEVDEESVDLLPQTLGEALEELDWDPVMRAALGQPIFERFVAAKEREWNDYRRHISQWELENYLQSA